jgi:hypothetical protein
MCFHDDNRPSITTEMTLGTILILAPNEGGASIEQFLRPGAPHDFAS